MANGRIIWCFCAADAAAFAVVDFFPFFIFISLFVNVRYLLLSKGVAALHSGSSHTHTDTICTYHTLLSSIVIIIIIIIWFPNQFIRCTHQQTIFAVWLCVCRPALNCNCNYNNSITKWLLPNVWDCCVIVDDAPAGATTLNWHTFLQQFANDVLHCFYNTHILLYYANTVYMRCDCFQWAFFFFICVCVCAYCTHSVNSSRPSRLHRSLYKCSRVSRGDCYHCWYFQLARLH